MKRKIHLNALCLSNKETEKVKKFHLDIRATYKYPVNTS